MKHSMTVVLLMLFACMLPAQTNLSAPSQQSVSAGYTAKNGDVVETGMVSLKGRQVTTADSLIKCHGECEITLHDVILRADELDFHQSTGEVEARGIVRVRLVPQAAPGVR